MDVSNNWARETQGGTVAERKATARPKKSGIAITGMGMGSPVAPRAKTSYQFRGRTIEIVPPNEHQMAMARPDKPAQGTLRIDGRDVMYEQTDEGVYSHEMMYQRFSTPEELAEELVRQWGTQIPPPAPMHMPMPRAKSRAKRRTVRAKRRK